MGQQRLVAKLVCLIGLGGIVGEPLTLHWVAGLAKVSASAIGCGFQAETFEKFATDGAIGGSPIFG